MLVTANVFQPLIDVFETVLKFFHNSGGISWGWSIVLLTIAVRAVLVPLTFRQIKSMVRMQTFAPQMKELQQKYKDDKQRQQQEMMKFYKENNVNPLSSCLPMVLQLPVFISLYYMLRQSLRNDICQGVQLKFQKAYALAHHVTLASAHGQTTACGSSAPGAHFLFVSDLTAKATGIELGILIVLYIGSQLGSTLVMSAATTDPTQRKIMMFMPLIFVLFVIRFPAGLLVYWITTNLWTVTQQYLVKKRVGPSQAAALATAGASGGGGSGGGSSVVATGSPGSGGNGGSGGGGGLGARLRERLATQAETAQTTRSGRSGNGDSGGGGVATKPSTRPARASTSKATTPKASTPRSGTPKSSNGGNGNGSNGSDGNGSGARGTPPPRPPRKKKKRSGRRR
jgi:YidC/Oxa1 family membrane protein insertase